MVTSELDDSSEIQEMLDISGMRDEAVYVRNTFIDSKPNGGPLPLLKSFSMPLASSLWDEILNEATKAGMVLTDRPEEGEDESLLTRNDKCTERIIEDAPNEKRGAEVEDKQQNMTLEEFVRKSEPLLKVPSVLLSSRSSEKSKEGSMRFSAKSVSEGSDSVFNVSDEILGNSFTFHSFSQGKATLEYTPAPIDIETQPTALDAMSPLLFPKVNVVEPSNAGDAVDADLLATFDESDATKEKKKINAIDESELTAELLAKIPRDENGVLLSVGSIEHASGNCRGCVFFHHSTKQCLNGARCLFCHYPHAPKKRIRVPKSRAGKHTSEKTAAPEGDVTPEQKSTTTFSKASCSPLYSHHMPAPTQNAKPYRDPAESRISSATSSPMHRPTVATASMDPRSNICDMQLKPPHPQQHPNYSPVRQPAGRCTNDSTEQPVVDGRQGYSTYLTLPYGLQSMHPLSLAPLRGSHFGVAHYRNNEVERHTNTPSGFRSL